ncbi:hypothetical protein [Pseudomonas chlororaphis]|nr:hypothetical protein [Pseudomonas chlororaphis]
MGSHFGLWIDVAQLRVEQRTGQALGQGLGVPLGVELLLNMFILHE